MRDIFYELIEEARCGKVIIDKEIWPIAFNTIIYERNNIKTSLFSDNNLSTLVIHNEEEFFNYLEKYLNLEKEIGRKCIKFYRDIDKNYLKTLISYLFINATLEDFKNPLTLIKRNIDFLNDNTFSYLNKGITFSMGDNLLNSILEIKNESQSVFMETPNKIELSLKENEYNQEIIYKLPSISYGIETNLKGEKVCYIYSILGEKKENKIDNEFTKKINRLLYKLNKGIKENQEYLDFKNGNSIYYPENISDVSLSSVLSLFIFITILKREGIRLIKGVPYLPLRYLSRTLVANLQLDLEKKESLNKRNDLIQNNITDKFVRTFRRVSYYINDLEFISYPFEFSEFLEIKLGLSKINSNNQIINEIENNINIIKR